MDKLEWWRELDPLWDSYSSRCRGAQDPRWQELGGPWGRLRVTRCLPLPTFLLQVGFLKILHRYEITFTLPPVHRLSKDIREAPVPSLHLKLLSVMPIPEGVCPAQGAGGLPSSSRAWM